jgi:hypothetical protein
MNSEIAHCAKMCRREMRKGGATMRTRALERRRQASAAVAEMMLDVFDASLIAHGGDRNIGAVVTEWTVAWTIIVNDVGKLPPISQIKISKRIGMSRQNVSRWVAPLVTSGIVKKLEGGYAMDDDYYAATLEAAHFQHAVAAIHTASKKLKMLKVIGVKANAKARDD